MPQLSDTMSEGTLVKWHKKEGDKISEGEAVADIETDKATMPLEVFESGTVAVQAAKEGDKVKVGGLIAVLATGGEKADEVKKQYAGGAAAASAPAAEKPKRAKVEAATAPAPVREPAMAGAASGKSPIHGQGGATRDGGMSSNIEEGRAQSRRESVHAEPTHSSEAISRQAHELISKSRGEDHAKGHGSSNGGRLKVSPLARRIAADRGIDLKSITGSGPGGRIVQRDVEGAGEGSTPEAREVTVQAGAAKTAPAEAGAPARVARGQKEVIPLTKMRAAIAAALQKSKSTIPHFYETVDIDLEQVVALRQRMNKELEAEKVRLSIGDFVSKAVASALVRHPALNATFDGTQITRYGDVNLGLAVALPDGLIVPVLRSIDQMGLKEIRVRSADLVERARSQRLKREELSGATFSVSNLGQYGIKDFNAIINPPEVGILAVGTGEKRAVVRNDQIVARTVMSVTLSCDHRAVDGATAAEFLATLKSLLEEPAMMLV